MPVQELRLKMGGGLIRERGRVRGTPRYMDLKESPNFGPSMVRILDIIQAFTPYSSGYG